ncbi:MAG: hypothetical protein LBQ93_01570 [Treponema sp.]|jgi:hypothetical protein|nr:hypothetical protein [Treponema sp.]
MDGQIISTVDAPEVILSEGVLAGDVLLKFYRDLGWNGQDILDPCKVRTTREVFANLHSVMSKASPDLLSIGMTLVNIGPGTDNYVPPGKVCLLEGWTRPDTSEGTVAEA